MKKVVYLRCRVRLYNTCIDRWRICIFTFFTRNVQKLGKLASFMSMNTKFDNLRNPPGVIHHFHYLSQFG